MIVGKATGFFGVIIGKSENSFSILPELALVPFCFFYDWKLYVTSYRWQSPQRRVVDRNQRAYATGVSA